MYEGMDRRRAERRESDFHVQIVDPHDEKAHIQDVSAGGALIVVTEIPRHQSLITISWPVEEGELPILIDARVVWTMEGDGATSTSAIGVQWVKLRAPNPAMLRSLLQEILQVTGGFAKMEQGTLHYTFPELKPLSVSSEETTTQVSVSVPEAPAPAGTPAPDDAPTVGMSGRVALPTKYRTQGKAKRGTIITLAERRIVVETEGHLPSHSDRVELKVSIPSTEGVLPLKLYGQVSRTRQATENRNASFWVLVTRVDECGRPGLFRQYVGHIS